MNIKNISIGVAALVLAFLVGMAVGGKSSQSLDLGSSGTRMPNGISADGTSPIAGEVRGTTLTVNGASTLAAVTASGFGKFGNAASSTVQVGAASKAGCLILGDSGNSASPVYIIASGATLTASTTKPAACQTVQ